ncbi:MAG: O-Antigen ligase [Syntrophorhabdus sp. PtaB.Bin047]|jgi:O-antigen ligase|nr:MAG: O-Antigen ligase [Syntrophorhabdus sp. PtaB.Bin047]
MEAQSRVSNERLGPSFVCFLIWTFIVMARPQDFTALLAPFRPVLLISVVTIVVMFLEGAVVPGSMFRLPEVRLVLLLYFIMLVGIPLAVHRGVAFRFLTSAMPATLLYLLVSIIQLRSVRRLNMTMATIALSLVFSASVYIAENAVHQSFRVAASAMYDPNDIAMLFATIIPLCLYTLFAGHGRAIKTLSIVGTCLAAAGIMMSRSRGGVMALVVVIAFFLLSSVPRIRGAAKIAVVLILAFVFINYFSMVQGRFENMAEDYNLNDENGRINLWKQNLIILSENPVLGTGAGCSAVALGLWRAREGGTQTWLTPHSSVLQIAVEAGIPGAVIFVILNFLAVRNLRRIRRNRDHPLSRLAFFVELSFYGFWTGGLLLSHGYSIHLYLLLGISAALRHLYEYPALSTSLAESKREEREEHATSNI